MVGLWGRFGLGPGAGASTSATSSSSSDHGVVDDVGHNNNKRDGHPKTNVASSRNMTQQAEDEDCLTCRLTGAAAFAGLGVYVFVSGHRQLAESWRADLRATSREGRSKSNLQRVQGSGNGGNGGTSSYDTSRSRSRLLLRQRSVTGLAAGLVGLGLYRLLI